jgi:hypothetical protein
MANLKNVKIVMASIQITQKIICGDAMLADSIK